MRTNGFCSSPAHALDHVQAGLVGLHHHVEQHHGHVRVLGQGLTASAPE
jgi:hypothetical protein